MKPLFSIIIPVYNVAPYLRECLDSLRNQTFVNWEAICVDDGSTDGSGSILDTYAAKDLRFNILHENNTGVSVARNKAISLASGEWLYFADGDDILLPDALERYAAAIAQNGSVDAFLLSSGTFEFTIAPPPHSDGNGQAIKICDTPRAAPDLWSAPGISARPFLQILRTSVFKHIEYPAGVSMMEDRLRFAELLSVKARWATLNIRAYAYRQREQSASHDFSRKQCLCALNTLHRITIAAISTLGCTREQMESYWHYTHGILEVYLRNLVNGTDLSAARDAAMTALLIEKTANCRILRFWDRAKCHAVLHAGLSLAHAISLAESISLFPAKLWRRLAKTKHSNSNHPEKNRQPQRNKGTEHESA